MVVTPLIRRAGPAVRSRWFQPPAREPRLLYPVERISIHHPYKLIVDGTAPRGLTNTKGQLLDGANRGLPDSNFRAPLTWRNLVLDPPWPKVSHPTEPDDAAARQEARPGVAQS
jgi:hypothetical protein